MHITKLSLLNFRNFTYVEDIEFAPNGVLMVAAPNATGKTNFLESLVLLLRGKSWRASAADCIQWNKKNFVIQGSVTTDANEIHLLSLYYNNQDRKLRLEEDGVPISLVTFYQKYPLVLFLPEDTFLFARGPEFRRNFLNGVLMSHPQYIATLVQYNRVLKQRNAALKKAHSSADIAAWTDLLVKYGETLWNIRRAFIEFVSTHLAGHYEQFSQEKRSFGVTLQTQGTIETLKTKFEQSFEQERRLGYTLYGPHRDDMHMTVDGKEAAVALSQGQTRNVVVALKIIAYHFLKHITKETPLVLLDEVLSELDPIRQKKLVEHLPNTQVIVTATEVPTMNQTRLDIHYLDLRSILIANSEEEVTQPEFSSSPIQAHA